MNISLGPEMTQYVEQKVRSGGYKSGDAVVEDALRRLRSCDLPQEIGGAGLERLIAVGQADADRGELIDGELVLEQRRQNRAARRHGAA